MRGMAWWLAGLLVLSGCIEEPPSDGGGDGTGHDGGNDGAGSDGHSAPVGEASAMDVRDAAEDAASAWDPDAVLMGVWAVEQELTYDDDDAEEDGMDPSDEWAQPLWANPDPEVGNGLAQAWAFFYEAGDDERAFRVVVGHDGHIHSAQEPEDDDLPTGGFVDWRVDSDDAVEVAKAHHRGLANVSQDDEVTLALEIGDDGNSTDPWWYIVLDQDEDTSILFVNANNGTYMGKFGWNWDWAFGPFFGPTPEEGTFEGALSPAEPEAEHVFEVTDAHHPQLIVQVVLRGTPGNTIYVALSAPDAKPIERDVSLGAEGATERFEIDEPWKGAYTVRLRLEDGVAARYEVNWCATGFTFEFRIVPKTPADEDGCDRVAGEGGLGSPWPLHG